MKKMLFTLFSLILLSQLSSAKEFISLPLHKDNNFIKINVSGEEELTNLLKGRDVELNVVLNFLKTLDFCNGVVSDVIHERYLKTLALLPEDVAAKVKSAEKEILERKKTSLFIVNTRHFEHYLPIKFVDTKR